MAFLKRAFSLLFEPVQLGQRSPVNPGKQLFVALVLYAIAHTLICYLARPWLLNQQMMDFFFVYGLGVVVGTMFYLILGAILAFALIRKSGQNFKFGSVLMIITYGFVPHAAEEFIIYIVQNPLYNVLTFALPIVWAALVGLALHGFTSINKWVCMLVMLFVRAVWWSIELWLYGVAN